MLTREGARVGPDVASNPFHNSIPSTSALPTPKRSHQQINHNFTINSLTMSYAGRPLRGPSIGTSLNSASQSSSGATQSPILVARIAEKKAELANLKELQALSAGLADQMQMLADKLGTLSSGTEGMYAT